MSEELKKAADRLVKVLAKVLNQAADNIEKKLPIDVKDLKLEDLEEDS